MALGALPEPEGGQSSDQQTVKNCPVCGGEMELVYDRHHQKVMACVDCQSGLTVPASAWEIARAKRKSGTV
jgi:ssDNA-binding Zn-finger/Zn-ribbon topoisomerase 1